MQLGVILCRFLSAEAVFPASADTTPQWGQSFAVQVEVSQRDASAQPVVVLRQTAVSRLVEKPLGREKIVQMLGTLEGPVAAARDKALLLLSFAGGLRRAELTALRIEHVHRHRKGTTITIPRSKTDQEERRREVEILFGSGS